MADPLDVFIIDEITYQTGYEVDVAISPESQIEAAIRHYMGTSDSLQAAVDTLTAERAAEAIGLSENFSPP
jgi:citrate lyase beta subunit